MLYVLAYIVLAIALSIPVADALRNGAASHSIRLTRGLIVCLSVSVVHVLLLLLGMAIGNWIRFDMAEYDVPISLGLWVIVALRMALPALRRSKTDPVAYDLSQWRTVWMLGLATGINTFFVGLGVGFIPQLDTDLWKASIPLLVSIFLLGYLGIMLGRRHTSVRSRRWQLIAALLLLALALLTRVLL